LIIDNSCLFQLISKHIESFFITCVQTISFKLPHFSFSHLLGFVNLLLIQLNGISVGSSTARNNWDIRFVLVIHVQVWIIIFIYSFRFDFSVASSSVCLSNPTLKLCNRTLFQFFPH
jgi:hypothetical protein